MADSWCEQVVSHGWYFWFILFLLPIQKSLRYFVGIYCLDAVHWPGSPTRPLIHPLAHLVSVSSSSMLAAGSLEATWRWNLKPVSRRYLNIGSSPRESAVSLLNFAMLAVHRFGPHPVRMLLHGVISLHGVLLSLPTIFTPSFKEFFRLGRAMAVVLLLGMGEEGASRTSLSYMGSFQSIYLQPSLPKPRCAVPVSLLTRLSFPPLLKAWQMWLGLM